jgi:hypothetical protein
MPGRTVERVDPAVATATTALQALANELGTSIYGALAYINNYLIQQLVGGGYATPVVTVQAVVAPDALNSRLSNGWQYVAQLTTGGIVIQHQLDLNSVASPEDLEAKLEPLGIKVSQEKAPPPMAQTRIYSVRPGGGPPQPGGLKVVWRCFKFNGMIICYQSPSP